MDLEQFEKLVVKAVDELPQEIRNHMKNLAITVDVTPTLEQTKKTGLKRGHVLLGLYEGLPATKWGEGFGNHLPDKITIFYDSITQFAGTTEMLKKLVKTVVWHEIAHHFGIDDKRVRELEKKWNSD